MILLISIDFANLYATLKTAVKVKHCQVTNDYDRYVKTKPDVLLPILTNQSFSKREDWILKGIRCSVMLD